MRVRALRSEFETLLRSHGFPHGPLTPAIGIDAMLQFFERVRVSRCSIEEQADMLLYQWGTYDWGRGQHFELNITRQVIPSSLVADPDILQLQLTFRYQPTPELRLLGKGDRWCESPVLLGGFREFILGSNAFQAVAARSDGAAEVSFDSAE